MPVELVRCPTHQALYFLSHGCPACRQEDAAKQPRGTIKPLRGEHWEFPPKDAA